MAALRRYTTAKFLTMGQFRKQYSSAAKLVDVNVSDKTGIATVSMNKPPVNSLNLEFITELNYNFQELEKSKCRGIILTSALPKVFSAGLDILEMYKPDLKRAESFWRALQDLWLTLYGLALPTAAAVNGASPAGGCLLATSCEYRVFVEGKHTIGLNETQLGIIAPKWFQDTFVNVIGQRQGEISLLRGSLYTPEEALKIGLVDELATNKEEAIAKCEKYIAAYAKISPGARSATKHQLRKSALSWLEKNRDFDVKIFIGFLEQPQVQKGLDMYIQSLKKK
ncbi:enoyl-CoA delta isomerase 1, mitochondrial-like isoform X1 [Neodiprion fabricii]|uniref:enoyl-CoA delta isomerase 1, mitochondrial-like isoform X1 n=1 Tax=Neodiprion fabricii TaxID=2872261 RepID=UPI001ED96590|nr:enoyl-CoA delta isomerase 1, mitochondrial-like isoform X1 [Neodiprion fabricii]XP_046421096.1 enoyl-CoA delta isomerase 1, mitochondrial-like isoform X1 [Neodiprion fabricii]XP_046421097.1 enoyl-CoA delta isomerase 1, mitochondrial-like isoform X1 [Neodiprion fabricii]